MREGHVRLWASDMLSSRLRFRRVSGQSEILGALARKLAIFTYRISSECARNEQKADKTDFLHSQIAMFESSKVCRLR